MKILITLLFSSLNLFALETPLPFPLCGENEARLLVTQKNKKIVLSAYPKMPEELIINLNQQQQQMALPFLNKNIITHILVKKKSLDKKSLEVEIRKIKEDTANPNIRNEDYGFKTLKEIPCIK